MSVVFRLWKGAGQGTKVKSHEELTLVEAGQGRGGDSTPCPLHSLLRFFSCP